MGNPHSDPTANMAIGSADREWFRMVKLAIRIRTRPNPEKDFELLRDFTGIYRRLLDETTENLEMILKKKKQ